MEKEPEQGPLVTALEAENYKVVRENWYKHISAPLQEGRGLTWVGLRGRDPVATPLAAHFSACRPEKVPVI